MQPDPFADLQKWESVLEHVGRLADADRLDDHQPDLIRTLAYHGNWRLREETLRKSFAIQKPSEAMIQQVLRIIVDENLYYEVRTLACLLMVDLLHKVGSQYTTTQKTIQQMTQKLLSIPQPSIFADALKKLC